MISKEEVKHIAKLARLELTEKEVEKMQKDLSSILDYFNLLKKIPKSKASGTPTPANAVSENTRKDEVVARSSSLAGTLVSMAPASNDGYIKVKQVL